MRLLSFLAGLAAGVWLSDSMGRPSPRGVPRNAGTVPAGTMAQRQPPGGERDVPSHVRPRTDAEIAERIRSQFDRTLASPGTIEVDVRDGCVTLRGRAQARDVMLLLAEVDYTAGVTSVRNELQIDGSLQEIASPLTRDKPAVRQAERATSHMS